MEAGRQEGPVTRNAEWKLGFYYYSFIWYCVVFCVDFDKEQLQDFTCLEVLAGPDGPFFSYFRVIWEALA